MKPLVLIVCLSLGSLFPMAGRAEEPLSAIEAAKEIDRLLRDAWEHEDLSPAEQSSDAEFCRRIWLDLAGVAPPITEIRGFLKDDSPASQTEKRSALVARLLASPQHATHMAATWNDILLPSDAQSIQQRRNVRALQSWLRDQFIDNTPYDYFVASFLTAGGAGNQGPAVFYTTREVAPKKIAAATSKIFLGIQLQCAECHDHPFDRWTQNDFWSYAAFFGQIQQSDQRVSGAQLIIDRPGGEVTMPDSDEPVTPRYPGVSELPEDDITNNRRRQLTIWMASRDNDYFVRAAVNRAWAHMFGRGLVDPVDAMDKDNPPSHPEVLNYLAKHFVQHRFDLRTLLATIAETEAYQLSSAFDANERPPQASFAVMNVKTLTARQYFDSVRQNVLRSSPTLAANGIDPQREQFVTRMSSSGTSPRDYPHGVMQALGVMNGPEISVATNTQQSGLLASLQAPFFSDDDRIEALFLATLSRLPTEKEQAQIELFETDSPETLSDVLWSLLNTAEATVCP